VNIVKYELALLFTSAAMSNPRSSWRFCSAQFIFWLQWTYPTYWQPIFILIILTLTFLM